MWARDEATRRVMLPRDSSGHPLDPVEDLDESLAPRVIRLSDPTREAAIAAL